MSAPEKEASRRQSAVLRRLSSMGASAQAAIPGIYAWAITVAPAAWTKGTPLVAKIVSLVGVIALVTAPFVELAGSAAPPPAGTLSAPRSRFRLAFLRDWTGPTWARIWSVWGLVLSSAIVWALAPSALSSVRLDGVRGALGVIGWALFAFASAGPSLHADPEADARIALGTALRPRSELPRGDGAYIVFGVLAALAIQTVGWGIVAPERAVLVRLVTVACGVALLGGSAAIGLARHTTRVPASRRLRLRRVLPWLVLLVLLGAAGAAFVSR